MSSLQVSTQGRTAMGVVATGAACVALVQLRRVWWHMKRSTGKSKAPKLAADADILRLGYSQKKLPADIDHIIVGSGLSGLYLAALLSKLGRKVLVLEQHYVAGGCTHTFKDKGFEFDTGVHYVGQATQLAAMMDFASGRPGAFEFSRSGIEDGSNVYNEITVGGYTHRFRPGKEQFIGDLVARFPDQEAALRLFFREVLYGAMAMGLVTSKQMLSPAVWKLMINMPGPARWISKRYIERTLSTVLTDCGVTDNTLRSLLSAEFGDYGVVPDEAPFFMQAIILFHYIWEGGFYPKGGSDAFAESLVPTILDAGGSVMVRAPVSRIVVENGRAVGVEVNGKGMVRARCSVISAAGAEVTYRKLLDEVLVQKMGGPPQSVLATEKKGVAHHVYGFIGFDGTSAELGLPTHNIWSFPVKDGETPDLTQAWKSVFGSEKGTPPSFLESEESANQMQLPCFISFPSAKDTSYNTKCPGKSSAVIISESRAEYFAMAGPVNKRGDEYKQVKERYKQALLNAVLRHFPGLKSKVSYVDVATPLSNEHYLGRASSYGLDQDAARFLDPTLSVCVPQIRGLYLTGQDLMCCGVMGQPIVAWLTLAKVLGVTSPDLWILLGDFALAVIRRTLFAPGPTHPGVREICRWLFC